jgi:hypothetical protein
MAKRSRCCFSKEGKIAELGGVVKGGKIGRVEDRKKREGRARRRSRSAVVA